MDPTEEQRLLKLFEEVETDEELPEPFSSGSDDNYEPQNDSDNCSSDSETNQALLQVHNPTPASDSENFTELSDGRISPVNDLDSDWHSDVADIDDFSVYSVEERITLEDPGQTPFEIFRKLWTDEIMILLTNCTNIYGRSIISESRPKTRFSRSTNFKPTDQQELNKFLGLCLLQGQLRSSNIRKLFSLDPVNYHPIFRSTMSGRRFEQILRCFSAHSKQEAPNNDRLQKVRQLLDLCIKNFQSSYHPPKQLSLDESLLLFRGRLSFRTYMKNKKTKYGIKFYELCSPTGFVLNLEIYKGHGEKEPDEDVSKIEALVLRLMGPYLNKGYHLFMDNYYNSIKLANRLLSWKTHVTGTLRSNRRGNPVLVTKAKLKKGDHIWKRQGKVYISKWKDKRDVIVITTAHHPTLISSKNRRGQEKIKPLEIVDYNQYMSGIDRSDQMVSYYSCPRKTIFWYKKVIFHLLDLTVWNSFFLYQKIHNTKISFIDFREMLIKTLIGIDPNIKDGRALIKFSPVHTPQQNASAENHGNVVNNQHFQECIPCPENYNRNRYFLRCKQCSKDGKRKETSFRCKTCPEKPAICPGSCFELWHTQM